jgi:N-methylhydantoinase A
MIIGLDVGGTNTDVVLLGETGIERQTKVPTDPDNLFEVVWTGLQQVIRGVPVERIRRVVLSTTLSTNAIAENKLVPVGMIVSGGPGVDPLQFSTGNHFFSVSGSIDHRGREVRAIDPLEIEAIRSRLLSEDIRIVGVVSKFSVRNPKHELKMQELLGDDFEYVILGHQVSGNLSFPRRIATAYLNGAVYPIYKRFFEAVQDCLEKEGLDIPIYVLKADGGTMSLEASLAFPGQTILSGPAASVMGAVPYAPAHHDAVVLDIGGTTTDMAVLINGVPLLDPHGIELGHYKTLIRSLQTHSIALGGDSAVCLVDGALQVGPARLGPAMAFGGTTPTPTDALFVLGKQMEGDRFAARRGMQSLADGLRISLEEAAAQVFDKACEIILDGVREMLAWVNSKPVYTVHELLDGYQVQPRHFMVLGGPAPYFACRLEELSGYQVQVVPRWQVANAIGAAIARTTCEVALFADTERGIVSASEENFYRPIKANFTREQAIELAYQLLKTKALREGADDRDLEMDLLEDLQFNMVRDFYTTGRNIRVKVQIKPGLIHDYRRIEGKVPTVFADQPSGVFR